MWTDSRKARWTLLALWAGLAVVLAAAEGIGGVGAQNIDVARAEASAGPCVSDVDEVTRMARLAPADTDSAAE